MPYIFTGDIDYEKTLEGWAGEPRVLSGLLSRNIARGWAMIQDNQEGMNQIMEGPGRLLG